MTQKESLNRQRVWTKKECEQLSKLVDTFGHAEVMCGLANRVATDHPDFKTGLVIRDEIVELAQLVQKTWKVK